MGIYTAAVQKLYVAYFNRPADYLGLQYWEGVLTANGGNTAPISQSFSTSAEYIATYAGMTNAQVVNQVYMNLFGRGADDIAGLTFWSNHLTNGTLSVSNVVTAIAAGARGSDLTAYNNKVAAATSFTAALDTTAEVIGYDGAGANNAAKLWMSGITTDASLVAATAPTALNASIATVVNAGAVSGKDYVLQEGSEIVKVTGGLADRIFGSIDGDDSTLNSGDVIVGNGKTILRLGVDDVSDDVPNADVTGVSVVEFVGGTNGTLTFDNGWDIDTLRVVNSDNSFYVEHENMSADLNVEVVNGDYNWIWGTFTNDWWQQIGATGDLSVIDGNITGLADKDGYLFVSYSAQEDEAGSLTLGNVTMSAVDNEGSTAEFYVYQTEDVGGDITIGNISISGFDNISASIQNTSHTNDDTIAHSITVGNVSLDINESGYGYFYLSNTGNSQEEIGNVTVGNVTVTLEDSASADLYFANGFGGDSDDFTVGSTTIGNITFNVGANASGDFTLSNSASADNVVMGATTIGNIALNVANSGDMTFTLDRYVYASSSANVGAYTVGDVSINVGINASASFSIYDQISVTGVDADDFSMGLFKMGNLTAIVDDGGYLDFDVSADYSGGTGSFSSTQIKEFSSFQFGNTFIQAGADATSYYTFDIEAEGDIGSITRGDVTLVGLKDAYVWFSESFSANTSGAEIGSYKAGNITLTAGETATVSYSLEFSAYNDNTLGTITLGNVAVNAIGKSASAEFSLSAYSSDFTSIGKFTTGNVSVIATGEAADAEFFAYVCAENDADGAQFGNVTVTANGKNASASFSATFEAEEVGAITVGNVVMTAIGEGASAYFNLSVDASDSSGTLTVGNISLAITGAAKKTGTEIDVYLSNSASEGGGDVVVGNITLSSTSVRASDDTAMSYDADVSIYADGDIRVGNITVIGGDVDSEINDWGTLANWLTLSADGSVTVGNVDYSGYTGKSSVTNEIDLSDFRGAAVIKGSARKDNIYDTEDTNQITGGSSADKFTFSSDNSGKTLSSMDKIMDFSYSGGDTIDVGSAGSSAEYMEASFAGFSDFVSAANAGDKSIYVGNVTGAGGLIIAVDEDGDDSVDYMIQLVGVTTLANIDMATFV